jgi:dephospho-CoA kinase
MYLDPLSTDFRSLQQWAQRIPSVEAEDERRISRLMEKLPEMTKGNIRDRFYQERI